MTGRPAGPVGPAPVGVDRRSLPLAGTPGTVALGREFARGALRAWGWLPAETAPGMDGSEVDGAGMDGSEVDGAGMDGSEVDGAGVDGASRQPDDAVRTAAEDVLLMTSELVTNACQHATGPYRLELSRRGPLLRVEVRDGDDRLPVLRPPQVRARPGGHGLRVVDRLSAAWGYEPVAGGGKRVWLEVVRPPGER